MNKLKALVQWFMRLELKEHRHWCTIPRGFNDSSCKHMTACWFCKGVFCANVERKDCSECEVKNRALNEALGF